MLGAGFFQFSEVGPWLEVSGVANVPISSSLYLNGELAFAYAQNSYDKRLDYDADGVTDLNTDRLTLLGLFPRATLGVRLSRAFALEIGSFVGVAHTALKSTKCGESNKTGAGSSATLGHGSCVFREDARA